MAIEFEVVTLFPAMIEAQLSGGVVKRALDRGLARVGCVDPRAFAKDAHRTVDDRPYGGGARNGDEAGCGGVGHR